MAKFKLLSALQHATEVLNLLDAAGIPVDRLIGISNAQGPQAKLIKAIITGEEIRPEDFPSVIRQSPLPQLGPAKTKKSRVKSSQK